VYALFLGGKKTFIVITIMHKTYYLKSNGWMELAQILHSDFESVQHFFGSTD